MSSVCARRGGLLTVVMAAAALALPASALASPSHHPRARESVVPGVNAITPCVGLPGAPAHLQHVLVLFMENHPYVDIIGSPHAPYANSLAQRCGLATNYHNITHPSAPEYLTATSGLPGGAGDCPPVFLEGWPAPCPDANNNIFHQATEAGLTWKEYEESMAVNCFEGQDSSSYDINHNPAAYYTDLGGPSGVPGSPCKQFDVPLGNPHSGNFETDLAKGTLPNYSFIAPNLIHDTHNAPIIVGDRYLSELIPTILNSREYRDGSTVLFLTWDEGEGGTSDNCAYNTTDIGCHVPMIVVSPYTTPGATSATLFNHYSLLKTSEQLLGLTLLAHAGDPQVASLSGAFGL